MTAEQKLKEEIKERIEHVPAERLSDVLDFIKNMEENSEIAEVMSFAGMFNDLDEDLFEDLTTKLHDNRVAQSRSISELWKKHYLILIFFPIF